MKIFENEQYMEDVYIVSNMELPWGKLQNKSILISGATGLIGSFLADVIVELNRSRKIDCKVYALGRSEEKAKNRFEYCWDEEYFEFMSYDINKPLVSEKIGNVDYIFHLASNTHPLAYATDPIGTITTNIVGLQNILEFAIEHNAVRVAFASSNEIYGENRGDVEKFKEEYCGYIDCNTMRAGYPESKRCGEALCQAYIKQKNLDIVIPRLTRSYGPTLLKSDTKALSQFLSKGVSKEDIVLKSAGTQFFSYTYVADAVSGLLTVLLRGTCGEAYNIADEASDIRLKNLAEIVAEYAGKKVIFDVPDTLESIGYSKATKARLDSAKLQALGWKAHYSIKEGIYRTLNILENVD